MLSKIYSGATYGLEGVLIEVEVDIASQGLPAFNIVGLPDKAVEEAKERVRSALKNSGADFPARRITVNLAPADLPKEGPAFDLPMAVGVLFASEQLVKKDLSKMMFLGELSLDGSLRHTNGILSVCMLAREKGFKEIYLPAVNAKEASIVKGLTVYPVKDLVSLFRHFSGTQEIEPEPLANLKELFDLPTSEFDFAEVQGQEHVKRGLEVAAAGGHNVFMKGTPGSGKTMLSRAFPGILPSLTEDEALEVTKIYSVTGNLSDGQSVVRSRPFRSPHHTTSRIGLIGGGSRPMPGEISLAHRGVLFLDEFPEFPRHVLEALRQPMEDGIVTISRAKGTVEYPAKFTLVAASNPCPCGYYGSDQNKCKCLPGQISRYQKRVSGPILDRIDIHIDVPQVRVEKLIENKTPSESSDSIQKRVEAARDIQLKRFKEKGIVSNAEMSTKQVKEFCSLPKDGEIVMRQAVNLLGLSARSYYRVIKVARTIADIEGAKEIETKHLTEALQYRPKEDSLL